ncbi:MFS transporter [Thozetella sp. PMI_491]|nr:MFS transporter [Thozetella sp. PMI_491]
MEGSDKEFKPSSQSPENNQVDDVEAMKPVSVLAAQQDDEGMKVVAAYAGETEWTEEEERKLVRKIDLRLLTLLTASYGLQFYDKTMLGQAAIFGLKTDLDLNVDNRYSMASSIFYIGFLVGAVPATLMAQRYPVERVVFGIVCLWGACLMAAAACQTWTTLYVQRFFLGLLESGVSPMFMLAVGSFYTKGEQAVRQGVWYSSTGFVSIFSPLINYGLGHITNGALASWRYMFLFAGGLTVVWSFVLLFTFPPDPVRVKGFSERERYIAIARLRTNNTGVRNTHFKKAQVVELLVDIKFWVLFAMGFLNQIPNGPGSAFLPIIISGFGFSSFNSLLLYMPYGFIAGIACFGLPFLAYKFPNKRCFVIISGYLTTIAACALLWKLPRDGKGALLFSCYLFPFWGGSFAVIMGLATANNAGYTKRSVASSGLFVGYCLGNIVAPLLFKDTESPIFTSGWIAVLACICAATVLALGYRQICVWENSKRDRAGFVEGFDHAFEDDLTDKSNLQFRYTY